MNDKIYETKFIDYMEYLVEELRYNMNDVTILEDLWKKLGGDEFSEMFVQSLYLEEILKASCNVNSFTEKSEMYDLLFKIATSYFNPFVVKDISLFLEFFNVQMKNSESEQISRIESVLNILNELPESMLRKCEKDESFRSITLFIQKSYIKSKEKLDDEYIRILFVLLRHGKDCEIYEEILPTLVEREEFHTILINYTENQKNVDKLRDNKEFISTVEAVIDKYLCVYNTPHNCDYLTFFPLLINLVDKKLPLNLDLLLHKALIFYEKRPGIWMGYVSLLVLLICKKNWTLGHDYDLEPHRENVFNFISLSKLTGAMSGELLAKIMKVLS